MAFVRSGFRHNVGLKRSMVSFPVKSVLLGFCLMAGLSTPSFAASLPEDDRAAVVLSYFAVGSDDRPSTNITLSQFTAQMDELSSGVYTVMKLSDIITAFRTGKKLSPRTVAVTFDGADKTVIENAFPVLLAHKIPFTVFVPPALISMHDQSVMNWDDLRTIQKSGLATFGAHTSGYSYLNGDTDSAEIKRQLNGALSAMRKELGVNADLFAYPQGLYDDSYKTILRKAGIKAAFGQQSGVAYKGSDMLALPRFTQIEQFSDIERFTTIASALPLPVTDISIVGTSGLSAIGFTTPQSLSGSLKDLSCLASTFGSSFAKPVVEVIENRVELRFRGKNDASPVSINCTMPEKDKLGGEKRWRWFGLLFAQNILKPVEQTAVQNENDLPD